MKNVMKAGLIWFFLLVISQLKAQELPVTGKIIDSMLRLPLDGATVSLVRQDGSILHSVTTDSMGRFLLKANVQEAKLVEVSFSGYRNKAISLSYNKLLQEYSLGAVYLFPQTSSLSEVVVMGKKPPVAFKIDRQVYKPSQFGNASGGNGIDALRNLPAITVNGQGEISFRGSGSFLVLLNGKPTQGDPTLVIGQLSAASIESIEVITSPSAAYDADGKSGIINIVTKTGSDNGWMVMASVMGGLPPLKDFDNRHYPQRYSADLSTGYRQNKWDISAGLNYLRNDAAGFREGDVFTVINNTKTSFPSMGERSFRRYSYGARMSAAYQANSRNAFTAGLYAGKRYQRRVADLLYRNQRVDLQTGASSSFSYFNENAQEKEGVFSLANLDYSHQFTNKAKLVLSALYEGANLTGTTYNNNIRSPGSKDTLQYTVNPFTNPLDAFRVKADYTQPLGGGSLQGGYQYRNDRQTGEFFYYTKVPGTAAFAVDPLFSSDVQTTNAIHAGYLQYNSAVNRLAYSGGLRLEGADRQLRFAKNSERRSLSLLNFFPSVQVRYKAWERGLLKGGYNRRIKRTNNYELNPFPEREHSETLEQGDPELLPELTGTFEGGLEQRLLNGSFFVNLYHQRIKNPIQRVNKVFNDTILNRLFTNAGMATQSGLEANLSVQITKWWQSITGGNVFRYNIEGAIFNGAIAIQNRSWVYSFNSTQSFTLPKNWSMQLSVNYLSARITAQGEDSRFLTPHFTLKKTSHNNRWSLQAQWLNIDAGMRQSNRQRITTFGKDFYTTTNYIYEPDQLQLTLSFNLSGKTRKVNLPVSEMGEKEF